MILHLMLVLAMNQAAVKKPPGFLLKSHSGKVEDTGSQDKLEEGRKPEEELFVHRLLPFESKGVHQ